MIAIFEQFSYYPGVNGHVTWFMTAFGASDILTRKSIRTVRWLLGFASV